ncbi:type II secretion system F family protein [Streptomyces antibioticus]|uniref:type II secretion system F family protein n=1 Tax=Streptomyces antibioticus TaxID=1890 RepID=UPI000691B00B|nr:type II secretion system F family protein [Streptomyces antibioticus]MCX4737692.1 type II secretion system F family protein [Streptomyces antibioticus]MCX5170537.1 type II secretion system F family protein [Streptomyces antibioticus]
MGAEVFHRLGVTLGVVLLLVWCVRWLETVRRRRRARRRLAGLLPWLPAAAKDAEAGRRVRRAAVRQWLPEIAVAGAGCAVVGGVGGLAVGAIGALALRRWRRGRRRPAEPVSAADARLAARQLPLAADLLAACIAAGAGPVIAAQAVGEALGGPVGEALERGAAEVRLGGEPATAWRRLAATPGAAALARLLERAGVSGVPAAGPVARVASDARADWTRAATIRARRAAVMVTAPVGLCFLPAFIAVGVAPVVIGLAGGALGGGR